jgi:hypothetical protein
VATTVGHVYQLTYYIGNTTGGGIFGTTNTVIVDLNGTPTYTHAHTVGRLAFAGRVLPDATLRGMRRFRSHGGIAAAVAGCGFLSEASSPGSPVTCQ